MNEKNYVLKVLNFENFFLVGSEFKSTLEGIVNSWLPAFDIVSAALDNAKELDTEGRLMMLETSGCPWKEHLFNLEQKRDIVGRTLYVVYKNKVVLCWNQKLKVFWKLKKRVCEFNKGSKN